MFVPSLVAALAAAERFAMTAGEQTRDLIHVDDVAAAIGAALGGPPGTYNVASGREHTMREIAAMVAALTGGDALLEIGAIPYRPGEQMRYLLDPSRAAASLGWRATTELARALEQLVRAAPA
jgi:nucleoside-diphosphate-sugar epimerase